MSDCFIFITGTGSQGGPVGEINLYGTAQEASQSYNVSWVCYVGYRDSIPLMQTKIKACVALNFLNEIGVVVGGSDKVTFVNGFS